MCDYIKKYYNEITSHTAQNGHHQKNLQTINVGEGMEKREPSYSVGGSIHHDRHYGEQYHFLKKINIELKCDPAIPLLGICCCSVAKSCWTP